MDDRLAIGILDNTCVQSKQNIKQYLTEQKTCYDSIIKLEVEGEAGVGKRSKPVTVKFLQANVTFKKNTIEMSENNKNAAHIEEHGTQKTAKIPAL